MRRVHFLLGYASLLVLTVGTTAPAAPDSPGASADAAKHWTADNGNGTFSNPLFYEEFEDPDVIRVGDDYYLAGTTMHMNPAVQLMHSKDLVNWELAGYCMDRLDLGPAFRLEGGRGIYGRGIWAPCIRHHKGMFYVFSNVNGVGLQVFRSKSIEGPWARNQLPGRHDLSVLFDDDGKVYIISGNRSPYPIEELSTDLRSFVPNAPKRYLNERMGEGHHLYKISDKYVDVSAIPGATTDQMVAVADSIDGPWKVERMVQGESLGVTTVAIDRATAGDRGLTLHQGGIVDTPSGQWWSIIMSDHGSAGRMVNLVPITWHDGFPLIGLPGNLRKAPNTWVKPNTGFTQDSKPAFVHDDNFDSGKLNPLWQWNHVPDDTKWSLTEKPGVLRLHSLPETDFYSARNSLCQRPPGPESIMTVELDTSGMVAGDTAGLALLSSPYAWIGVVRTAEGATLQMYSGPTRGRRFGPRRPGPATAGEPVVSLTAPPEHLWLRVHCNFDNDRAIFSWSTDGKRFTPLGNPFTMVFQLRTFQGVRPSLFHYNTTGQPGGYADFDNYAVAEPRARGIEREIPQGKTIVLTSGADGSFLAADTQNNKLVNVAADAVPENSKFQVVDLGLGRVALKAGNGKVVSVARPENVVLKDLGEGEPGDAESFQWINLMRGDTMLMSLTNHRYLATKPNSSGRVTAMATGPNPARKGGACFKWSEVSTSTTNPFFPLRDVRLLESPFSEAVKANRQYLLAHDPDRLLAPFRREAGLEPKARPYGNWESGGLDGHTAGHYLSALSLMMASDVDPDGQFRRRLDYMIDQLAQIQEANGNGYLGGIPGSKDYWRQIGDGNVRLIWKKWAPWYNLHKMFAGLRDAYVHGGNKTARDLLVRYGDWCDNLTSGLSDGQMQQMLSNEFGGMNEVLADIYAITGDKKYIELAKRFNHRAVFEPLENRQDRLTGLHANTQIPKITGLARIAALTDDAKAHATADFFWRTVTENRSVAFGGNSVSEHFNPTDDFSKMVTNREGPETCNTYNMLRLTRQLFAAEPKADYADFYERALYNHILAAINVKHPGYVYFTPIRPDHYRVYSRPGACFWCCVGTGMENPGRYGEFIYARAKDGIYVNLFIASELKADDGVVLHQETRFPYKASTRLVLTLKKSASFTLYLRHPSWVSADEFAVKVNGRSVDVASSPSSYVAIRREWKSGDTVDVALPMHTSVERLPDGSDWVAILHGPIVLAKPDGTEDMTGLFADSGRMAHVAHGPMVPLDNVPSLFTTLEDLPAHVVPDAAAGPLNFRIKDVIQPAEPEGLPLVPFFSLHERRYQMYWELTTPEKVAARREKLAAEERARAAREAATIDRVVVGEQQSEVEHDFKGERTETGIHNGRRWRHGAVIQYTLDTHGEKAVDLEVTYAGDDAGRTFDILANGTRIATQVLNREKPGEFIAKRYPIPQQVLNAAPGKRLTIKFVATRWLAGGLYDVRLMRHKDDAR
jgi:DUF1680 family protein/beta-xylosidase